MKKRFFVFLAGFLTLTSFTILHSYHVGSVDFSYNSTSKTFEVEGTFFMDDLEDAVNYNSSSKVYFKNKSHEKKMNTRVKAWAKRNFGLAVNQKVVSLDYLGYEEDRESVHIYLESTKVSSPKIVEVGVSALYHLFDDQLNIIHVKVDGVRKSHKLRNPKKYLKHEF